MDNGTKTVLMDTESSQLFTAEILTEAWQDNGKGR